MKRPKKIDLKEILKEVMAEINSEWPLSPKIEICLNKKNIIISDSTNSVKIPFSELNSDKDNPQLFRRAARRLMESWKIFYTKTFQETFTTEELIKMFKHE